MPGGAQPYPAKVIRLVVPTAAGGTADFLARLVADRLADTFRQKVVVDNRPGANGIIGMEAVIRSPADGYTIMSASMGNIAINPGLYGARFPFDPERDLAPVTQIADTSLVLVVHPSLPARSIRELIALAKAKPGTLDYVHAGSGSIIHLNTALFASMAGIKLNGVGYKGSAPGRTAVISGEVPIIIDGMILALPLIQSGRVRALGVTSAQRSPILPAVPAIGEAVPGYVGNVWYGIFAPAATPQDIVARLHSAIVGVLKAPDIKARLAEQGADVVASSPADFRRYVRSEIAKWTRVVKETGATAD